jgi:transposase
MACNFLRAERDQPFLLPPDLRDWLPQDHLAWFILDVVDQLDLAPFYLAHRDDGHGHPAYDPKLLLGVLLYGYCLGVRSSRQLERRCVEDIAFRVLAANQTPDHVTIARFRVRHEQALAGFLVASLRLCAAAGMVRVGTVALDGTKVAGNAADKANRTWTGSTPRAPRSSRTPPRPTSARTSSTAARVGMSCPKRWPARRLGWRGCGRPRPGWRRRPPNGPGASPSGSPPARRPVWRLPRRRSQGRAWRSACALAQLAREVCDRGAAAGQVASLAHRREGGQRGAEAGVLADPQRQALGLHGVAHPPAQLDPLDRAGVHDDVRVGTHRVGDHRSAPVRAGCRHHHRAPP